MSCGACDAELRDGARFCDACGSPVATTDTHAEYKQVTVLFADVVHSMDIAATLAPLRRGTGELEGAHDLSRGDDVQRRSGDERAAMRADGALRRGEKIGETASLGLASGLAARISPSTCESGRVRVLSL